MILILRHELRLIAREPRFWIPFLIPPIFLVAMQALMLSSFGAGAVSVFQPSLLLIIGALLSTMTVTLTADSFAGERERNTLELLLSLPLGLRSLFFGKLFAVLPLPMVLAILSQTLLWKLGGSMDAVTLCKACLYALSVCLVISATSLYVSLHAQTVRTAAQANVIFVLGILMGTQMVAQDYFALAWMPWLVTLGSLTLFAGVVFFALRKFVQLR